MYGGPILSTWFDRPLSIAGRVVIRTRMFLRPKQWVNRAANDNPNLAIHQNREVNNGVKIDRQKDVLPIVDFSE